MSLLLRVRAEWFCFVRFSDFPCPRWRPPLNFLLSHHLALGLFYLDLLLKEVDLMLLLNQLLLLLSDLLLLLPGQLHLLLLLLKEHSSHVLLLGVGRQKLVPKGGQLVDHDQKLELLLCQALLGPFDVFGFHRAPSQKPLLPVTGQQLLNGRHDFFQISVEVQLLLASRSSLGASWSLGFWGPTALQGAAILGWSLRVSTILGDPGWVSGLGFSCGGRALGGLVAGLLLPL